MIFEDQPKPWNRGRFDPYEDYATAIHRIGADLGAGDAGKYLRRLSWLRAAAAAHDDSCFVGEVDRIEGVLIAREGDHHRARALLGDAQDMFLALQEWTLAALAVANAAEIDYEEGELRRAADLYDNAADLAVREPDPAFEDAAGYRGHAAQCCLEAGEPDAAVVRYRQAIDLALQVPDLRQAAVWCHDLGTTLERIGDEDGALEQWRRSVDLDPEGDAASPSWSGISQIYRSWGRTGPAREAAENAGSTALDPASALNARYEAMALTVEYEPSTTLLEELRSLAGDYIADQNPRQSAYCRVLEAGLLHRAGRTAEAEQTWDEASAVVAGLQDWRSLAGFHTERANKLAESRDTLGARRHLTLAADLFDRAAMPTSAAMCRRNLAALNATDDPQRIREHWRERRDPVTREEAFEVLGLAGVEFVLQRFNRSAELADRALTFFDRHRLQHGELEARTLLAAIHTNRGRSDLAAEQLKVLIAATEDGMYPTIRAQALIVTGAGALGQGQFGISAAAYRAAVDVLDGIPGGADTATYALAQLNLAVSTIPTDPEEALRHASAASASFRSQGHVGYAARADLAAAMALTRIGSWQGAFDIAAPALLVTDILRAATASAPDRNRMREIWSMIHHRILEMIAEIDEPRLTAEVLERLRANATVPGQMLPAASSAAGPAMPVDVTMPLDDGPAITWDTQWSAADALLGPDRQLSAGLPPLVQMPWGIALEPYETIARQQLLGQSERHRRDRPVASWADQIGFA